MVQPVAVSPLLSDLSPAISAADVRPAATLLKALADGNRIRILALLIRGEQCVCHITAALELSQPNASQHLSVLRHAGVVGVERRGSWMYYRLLSDPDPVRARILAAVLEGCAALSAAADRRRLEEARACVPCR
jgi:ArsR family transcriptional regulator, arsenate/arsenite/antimonite-responsive transcriptional repressor